MRAITAAIALTLATTATADTWNLPAGYNENNYHSKNLVWFADEIRNATDGQVDIVVHPGASLVKLPEIKRAVQSGQVPIGEILLANSGNEDAYFEADMVPFLATGLDSAKALYDAQWANLEERFETQNLKMLYSVCWPGNGLFSKNELPSLAAMDGMKFRAYNAITARVAEQFGAQPVTIQVPELAQAFLTGLADVMLTSAPILVAAKASDFGDYFYNFNAFHPRNAVIVNKTTWDGLPEETRKTIEEIAAKAEDRGWELCREDQARSLDTIAENGITVIEPSDEMKAEFQTAAQAIIAEWETRAGQDGSDLRRAIGQ
ncbi:TRAP transporter substrate-binding protein [Sedimentitalea sp.]|uniref:TRAP transporter substrate-binding protein n=1 Tax=Sedimentitalea sp. TaxID=2048915 RepID=UPI00329893C5